MKIKTIKEKPLILFIGGFYFYILYLSKELAL